MKLSSSPKVIRFIFAVFLILGLIFGCVTVGVIVNNQAYMKTALPVEAEIVSINETGSTHRNRNIEVMVTYTVNGRSYTSDLNYYTAGMYIGQKITAYADPQYPGSIRSNTWILSLVFGILSGVFFLIGLLGILFSFKMSKSKKRLIETGIPIHAEVTSVRYNQHISVNGLHPYKIQCQGRHPDSGEAICFESEDLWFDPSPNLPGTLRVYVDARNARRYCVDVEELKQAYAGTKYHNT